MLNTRKLLDLIERLAIKRWIVKCISPLTIIPKSKNLSRDMKKSH